MNVIKAAEGSAVVLGREGENHATQVQFDIARWVQMYGEGRVELLCQRQQDAAPHPVLVERRGNIVIWTVTSADTARPGRHGRAELRYYAGDTLVKSEVIRLIVEDALGEPAETPPEPCQGWVDRVLEAAQRAENAAERVEGAEGGGTTDHAGLVNRDAADQHPMEAITGLVEALKTTGKEWGKEAFGLICELLEKAVYTADVSAQLEQLKALLETGGSGGGDSIEPEVTLARISAAYSGGSVPVGTSVSALIGVRVTAHYSDGSTATVTGYTLSGTIKEGSNTVTVSYGGKTTTFAVTGVADDSGDDGGSTGGGTTEPTDGAEHLTVTGATATDDGNGHVTVIGMAAADDGSGTITVF